MRSNFSKHVFLICGLASLLQACGGGGGDGSAPTPPPVAQYTLSGTIRPAADTAVDSDVNDPVAPYQSNDTIADAQPISNPVTLGGYVNRPGAGPGGRSRDAGDGRDIFRVGLLAGQQIDLLIAGDGVRDDLDLGLADLDGNLLDASVGQKRVESLTAPANGDYLVIVTAQSGASSYVLTIGQSLGASVSGMKLSDAFVPGEATMHFRDNGTTQSGGLRARAQALGLTARSRGELTERNRLLGFDDLRRMGVNQASTGAGLPGSFDGFHLANPAEQDKLETLYWIKALNQDPDVVAAMPNYIRRPLFVPNDPLYSFQWHYRQINLPQAWDVSTGADAIVAVIDTGVVISHPDLQGQLVDGYDFVADRNNAGDGDGIDPDPSDPGGQFSSTFHGTHIAGTVAAVTNNGIGGAGVAFGAKVMPLRVVGQFGYGTDYDIEQAVRYAARLPNDSGTVPQRRADVINLSIGGSESSADSQAVYDQARAAGAIVAAAAGNESSSTPSYPAAYPGVIAVSATDLNRALAYYSNYGSWIGVAAPGGNKYQDLNGDGKPDGVLSAGADNSGGQLVYDYPIWQGTSMATPHVAGVIALMKAIAPSLTPQDFANLLASGALTDQPDGSGRSDQFGYGLINAYKAVTVAASLAGRPVNPVPIPTVTPAVLNFGVSLTSQNLTVTNGGGGALTVNSPTEDSGGWLGVAPAQVDANGLGTYTITVKRTGLTEGVYSATLSFSANADPVQVRVTMEVANNPNGGGIGQQYVLLVRSDTGATVTKVAAQRQADGSYTYAIPNVLAGTYRIVAGSDANNDGHICEAGESCGAYPSLDAPVQLEVDRDRSGLDFVSGYPVNLADYQQSAASGKQAAGIQRGELGRLESSR